MVIASTAAIFASKAAAAAPQPGVASAEHQAAASFLQHIGININSGAT